ncbi:MAG TPA: MFS transporter [Caulobacteraceae bacterium]|nr:MFS transporter [Caulobacteraceae bacterium]
MTAAVITGPPRLPFQAKLFYGLGSIAFGVKDAGFSYFLLIFYNQVIGLNAAAAGLAILIAMAFDAFLDPIVGQVSDNWRSRWGRRHPFMYASALPVALSYIALWNPPHWSAAHLFWYLTAIAIVIRTFITFYEVPSSALSAELTTGYDERTVLLSYRYFFGWVGGLSINLIALFFLLRPDAHHAVGQLNPVGYARYGVVAGAIMFCAILISAGGTHRYIPTFTVPPKRKIRLLAMAREIVSTWSHRSFLFITLSGLATSMAAGLGASMNYYFATFYWEFSARQISAFTLGVAVSAAIALIAAPRFSRRFGKRASAITLMICSVTISLAPMALRLFGLMPANHSSALAPIIFFQTIVATAFYIAATTLISAMIADVVEDGELKTGRRSEGVYFSASSLVAKAVTGVGIFAAGVLLGVVHFPAGAAPGQVAPAVITRLAEVYIPVQITLYAVALILMLGYKITRASHGETLRLLAAEAETVHLAPVGIEP